LQNAQWFEINQNCLHIHAGVKLKLFCPEAKHSSPLFKFIELWGADLIEWGAILVEVNGSSGICQSIHPSIRQPMVHVL
jgi:hypothetical protein